MFGEYVYERSAAQYTDKILLLDDGALDSRTDYLSAFSAHGFEVVRYADDLTFRIGYEEKLRTPGKKMAVLARTGQYIPYDVRQRCRTCVVTLENLFPRLNTAALTEMDQAGLDRLSAAYPSNFEDLRRRGDTERFLSTLLNTLGMAAALAVGVILASSLFRAVFPLLMRGRDAAGRRLP